MKKTLKEYTEDKILETLHPYTKKLLETSKAPNDAFVALEVLKRSSYMEDGAMKTTLGTRTSLCVLGLENRPDQWSRIEQMMSRKGCKIICYGNFPKRNDNDPTRARRYTQFTNPVDERENTYDQMRDRIERAMFNTPIGQTERSAFNEEIARKEKEIEDLKKELEGKKDEPKTRSKGTKSRRSRTKKSEQPSSGIQSEEESGDARELGLPA